LSAVVSTFVLLASAGIPPEPAALSFTFLMTRTISSLVGGSQYISMLVSASAMFESSRVLVCWEVPQSVPPFLCCSESVMVCPYLSFTSRSGLQYMPARFLVIIHRFFLNFALISCFFRQAVYIVSFVFLQIPLHFPVGLYVLCWFLCGSS
jgi:uncharacterized integral membrane protein